MSFLSPNQQRQSTERISEHWLRPQQIIHWSHHFFIHHRTPRGRVLLPLPWLSDACTLCWN